MKSKKFVCVMLITAFVLLFLFAAFNFAIDPLFQYHLPWFGMKPIITSERYQNAGVAKTFDYDIALLGNSLSENFLVSDLNNTFGGKAVKLTSSDSYCLDWSYNLSTLKDHPGLKTVLFNFDPYCMKNTYKELKHSVPLYLYDNNYLNDVEYLLNVEITKSFTFNAINSNIAGDYPDYDRLFYWADDWEFGKEAVLKHERKELSSEEHDVEEYKENARKNIELLTPYFERMPDTQFVIFCSPFGMYFWDGEIRENTAVLEEEGYLTALEILTGYDNVQVFLWTDDEMLGIMSNLDNYTDGHHYSPEINKEILRRIKAGEGLLTQENYKEEVDKFFDFIYSFDYDSLFE